MKYLWLLTWLVAGTGHFASASAVSSSEGLVDEASLPAVQSAVTSAEFRLRGRKDRLISELQAYPNGAQDQCHREIELSNRCLGGSRGECQGTVRAYIYGQHPVSGAHTFIGPDAQPFTPGAGEPPQDRIAIPIPQGQNVTIRTPMCLNSGRIFFASNDGKLQFSGDLLDAKSLVMPSDANTKDKSRHVKWSFMEFTVNGAQGITFNPSLVDFAGLPLAMRLEHLNRVHSPVDVLGMKADAVASICEKLIQQAKVDGQPWNHLCVRSEDNKSFVRALAPKTLASMNATAFENYYVPYVDQVWGQYTGQDLVLDLGAGQGKHTCRVHSDQIMHCGATPFPKPSARDIFSCDSGPFRATSNEVVDQIIARLCAGFTRSTLHIGSVHPSNQVRPSQYYQHPITNHFARFVHEASHEGRGYAFPVDWVSPPNAASIDMVHGQFTLKDSGKLTVTVGGWR